MLVCGHSAGGHLAAATVATDWQALYPKAPADLVPAGFAISGVFDLRPLVNFSLNQDLRLSAEDAQRLSPLLWPVPPGRLLDVTVGDLESDAFKSQSRTMADTWRQAKADTRYVEYPGNHFTVIDALTDPNNAMVTRIAELTQRLKTLARAGVPGKSSTQADAAKIKAKPMMSLLDSRSPTISTVDNTPSTGMPRMPSAAVAAGTTGTISNHIA